MSYQTIEDVSARAQTMADEPISDRHRNPRQKFAVCSIVGPSGCNQKAPDLMIRMHGAFPTIEEANKYSRALRDSNDFFDYYAVEMHEWVPLPPRLDEIDDIQYTDTRVQNIRDSYINHLKGQKRDLIEKMERDDALRMAEKAKAIQQM